ncbi:GrpB family protein [Chromobacterium sphagni]|uniref:GrpB family protein n=1 Tax=Chromobacterium sphagni TaxID=1903179 RepID=A0A1S1WX33_9NEIS|nr:GrpB family protein [Chromobacterium sphagni]OHX11687.1 hypothetical protein BI347_18770 [Chromobacterium sphagni]OHX15536.1 hypothetical protein BI344_22065 [Chromobacterium sphagni]
MLEIIEHQPRWPEEFQRTAGQLQATPGALALRIDHIGYTAVPGLAAKGVIDVQVAVADLDDAVIASLAAGGFVHRPVKQDHAPARMTISENCSSASSSASAAPTSMCAGPAAPTSAMHCRSATICAPIPPRPQPTAS